MRLPDEYFIERSVGDLKIPILYPENCNQNGASISAKMLVSWLKERFFISNLVIHGPCIVYLDHTVHSLWN